MIIKSKAEQEYEALCAVEHQTAEQKARVNELRGMLIAEVDTYIREQLDAAPAEEIEALESRLKRRNS